MYLHLRLIIFSGSKAVTFSLSGRRLSVRGLSVRSEIMIVFSETESVLILVSSIFPSVK